MGPQSISSRSPSTLSCDMCAPAPRLSYTRQLRYASALLGANVELWYDLSLKAVKENVKFIRENGSYRTILNHRSIYYAWFLRLVLNFESGDNVDNPAKRAAFSSSTVCCGRI